VQLAAVHPGWWSSALEQADVISEGGTVREPDGEVYYGTTSVHCLVEGVALDEAQQLSALVMSDPHARLRLLRLAHREATVRSGGALGVLQVEMRGDVERDGDRCRVTIAVDVSAALIANRAIADSK
jgi:hypothetical protein